MVAAEVTADASWGVSTTDQRSFSARADSNDPSTSGLGGLEFVGRKSRNPAAFSRHRNSKVNDGNRTELTANSFSGGCWPISTPKIRNVHNRFP